MIKSIYYYNNFAVGNHEKLAVYISFNFTLASSNYEVINK